MDPGLAGILARGQFSLRSSSAKSRSHGSDRRGLEGAAERGRDAGVRRRHIDADDSAIHDAGPARKRFSLQLHADLQTTESGGKFRPGGTMQ